MKKYSRILIVEDEAISALMLKISLRELDYVVYEPAATGKEALMRVSEDTPDVVLMDVNLPGNMDGVEAARKIRDSCSAELIFMTGYSDIFQQERILELEPLACLEKPVSVENIHRILQIGPEKSGA